jgi:hypothetical protein
MLGVKRSERMLGVKQSACRRLKTGDKKQKT